MGQLAEAWWGARPSAVAQAAARMAALAEAGWVRSDALLARPMVSLRRPLVCWQPDETTPQFSTIAGTLRSRWQQAAAVLTPCVTPTAPTAEQFGRGTLRLPRVVEVTHDLHLAQVYLQMRRDLPTRARSWVIEDHVDDLGGAGEKRPDAYVTDGRHRTAIELAGEYDAKKLAAFHAFCTDEGLAYELW
ncbi:MAG: hypothetical protein IT293_01695 [Deltaproteobacteria bacterium]|nr:hypothetical protein [Deltaproteobacteria bacterium]